MGADAGSDCVLELEATGSINGFKVLDPDGNLRILRWRLVSLGSVSCEMGTPQAGTPIDEVDMNEVGLEEGPVRVPKDVEFPRSSNESQKLKRFDESGVKLSISETEDWLYSSRFPAGEKSSWVSRMLVDRLLESQNAVSDAEAVDIRASLGDDDTLESIDIGLDLPLAGDA